MVCFEFDMALYLKTSQKQHKTEVKVTSTPKEASETMDNITGRCEVKAKTAMAQANVTADQSNRIVGSARKKARA